MIITFKRQLTPHEIDLLNKIGCQVRVHGAGNTSDLLIPDNDFNFIVLKGAHVYYKGIQIVNLNESWVNYECLEQVLIHPDEFPYSAQQRDEFIRLNTEFNIRETLNEFLKFILTDGAIKYTSWAAGHFNRINELRRTNLTFFDEIVRSNEAYTQLAKWFPNWAYHEFDRSITGDYQQFSAAKFRSTCPTVKTLLPKKLRHYCESRYVEEAIAKARKIFHPTLHKKIESNNWHLNRLLNEEKVNTILQTFSYTERIEIIALIEKLLLGYRADDYYMLANNDSLLFESIELIASEQPSFISSDKFLSLIKALFQKSVSDFSMDFIRKQQEFTPLHLDFLSQNTEIYNTVMRGLFEEAIAELSKNKPIAIRLFGGDKAVTILDVVFSIKTLPLYLLDEDNLISLRRIASGMLQWVENGPLWCFSHGHLIDTLFPEDTDRDQLITALLAHKFSSTDIDRIRSEVTKFLSFFADANLRSRMSAEQTEQFHNLIHSWKEDGLLIDGTILGVLQCPEDNALFRELLLLSMEEDFATPFSSVEFISRKKTFLQFLNLHSNRDIRSVFFGNLRLRERFLELGLLTDDLPMVLANMQEHRYIYPDFTQLNFELIPLKDLLPFFIQLIPLHKPKVEAGRIAFNVGDILTQYLKQNILSPTVLDKWTIAIWPALIEFLTEVRNQPPLCYTTLNEFKALMRNQPPLSYEILFENLVKLFGPDDIHFVLPVLIKADLIPLDLTTEKKAKIITHHACMYAFQFIKGHFDQIHQHWQELTNLYLKNPEIGQIYLQAFYKEVLLQALNNYSMPQEILNIFYFASEKGTFISYPASKALEEIRGLSVDKYPNNELWTLLKSIDISTQSDPLLSQPSEHFESHELKYDFTQPHDSHEILAYNTAEFKTITDKPGNANNTKESKLETKSEQPLDTITDLTKVALPKKAGLDWHERPMETKETIDRAFKNLPQIPAWLANGFEDYHLMSLSQVDLMKKIILQNYPQRKDFYFLDIGAGQFQSVRHLCKKINEDKTLPQDIKVHCIGVRGERHLDEEIIEDGCCIRYELGYFKIECLETSFTERGLDFQNKVNLIVSSYTLSHLVDPTGTFLQAYSLLRIGSGLILSQGWYFAFNDSKQKLDKLAERDPSTFDYQMLWLLLQTNEPFIMTQTTDPQVLSPFALQRLQDNLTLPLSYHKLHQPESRLVTQTSHSVSVFNVVPSLLHESQSRFPPKLSEIDYVKWLRPQNKFNPEKIYWGNMALMKNLFPKDSLSDSYHLSKEADSEPVSLPLVPEHHITPPLAEELVVVSPEISGFDGSKNRHITKTGGSEKSVILQESSTKQNQEVSNSLPSVNGDSRIASKATPDSLQLATQQASYSAAAHYTAVEILKQAEIKPNSEAYTLLRDAAENLAYLYNQPDEKIVPVTSAKLYDQFVDDALAAQLIVRLPQANIELEQGARLTFYKDMRCILTKLALHMHEQQTTHVNQNALAALFGNNFDKIQCYLDTCPLIEKLNNQYQFKKGLLLSDYFFTAFMVNALGTPAAEPVVTVLEPHRCVTSKVTHNGSTVSSPQKPSDENDMTITKSDL